MALTSLFARDKSPHRGLYAFEWVVMVYLAATTLFVFCFWSRLGHPVEMLLMRARVLVVTLALWSLYRLLPLRLVVLLRAGAGLLMLSWWYPDTYEVNNIFPNLDHVFAGVEQSVFGCQPALLLSRAADNAVVSELMYLGYASYFPMIALVAAFYFFRRQKEFLFAMYVIIGAFFVYYVIFDLVPVAGPQYYYLVAGEDQVAQGVFPNVYDYFHFHSERMASPGYDGGLFYHFVEQAHDAGERPTAAFPSSHVGITTVLLLLAWRTRCRWLLWVLLPLAVLMLFATVYIKAHYAVDALAGLITGVVFYCILSRMTKLT